MSVAKLLIIFTDANVLKFKLLVRLLIFDLSSRKLQNPILFARLHFYKSI